MTKFPVTEWNAGVAQLLEEAQHDDSYLVYYVNEMCRSKKDIRAKRVHGKVVQRSIKTPLVNFILLTLDNDSIQALRNVVEHRRMMKQQQLFGIKELFGSCLQRKRFELAYFIYEEYFKGGERKLPCALSSLHPMQFAIGGIMEHRQKTQPVWLIDSQTSLIESLKTVLPVTRIVNIIMLYHIRITKCRQRQQQQQQQQQSAPLIRWTPPNKTTRKQQQQLAPIFRCFQKQQKTKKKRGTACNNNPKNNTNNKRRRLNNNNNRCYHRKAPPLLRVDLTTA